MVEAFLAGVSGDVVVIESREGAIEIPHAFADRVSAVFLPGLLYGEPGERHDALTRFGQLLSTASNLAVLGADTMDGLYQPRASVLRAALAEAAARAGVDSRIVGFSWPTEPRSAARRALRSACRAGAAILPRDPISAARLARDGIAPTRQVADIVFTSKDVDEGPRRRSRIAGPYAIVNASGHIARQHDLDADLVAVIAWLRRRGLEVVLLPHVVGGATDDRAVARRLARSFSRGVHLIEDSLTPAQVRGFTSVATLTVTGRMHLAIQSLAFGVPAISLASQGKVEGLMQLMGTPELCVAPRAGMADSIIELAESALPPDSAIREAIERALPTAVDLAHGNFVGLPAEKSEARPL